MDKSDYTKGKIYIIRSFSTRLCYIGSTVETLERRLQRHEEYEKEKENGENINITSLLVLIYKDYRIDLIERFPCDNKRELFWRERYWIDKFKSDEIEKDLIVNDKRPIISEEERQQWKKEYSEKYRETHKDYIREYNMKKYERIFSSSLNSLFTTEEEKQ